MAGKNNRLKKKQVRDTKATPPPRLTIDPGNVPVLTVKLLDQINRNITILIEELRNGRLE